MEYVEKTREVRATQLINSHKLFDYEPENFDIKIFDIKYDNDGLLEYVEVKSEPHELVHYFGHPLMETLCVYPGQYLVKERSIGNNYVIYKMDESDFNHRFHLKQ